MLERMVDSSRCRTGSKGRQMVRSIKMGDKELILSCISKSKILQWHVRCGEKVKRDKILATYVFTEKIADSNDFIVQRKLKAKLDGKIVELTVLPNEEITRGQVVARIQEELCEHPTVMKDMCCKCGADLRKESGMSGDLVDSISAAIPVVHNIHELRVSLKEAERLARYDEKQLLKARKLVLVVDLDMTLLHTTVEPVPKDAQDVHSFTLPGHPFVYHTKLRPGARRFLENISKFYELHIFTMGSRMYAHTVAKFLDPEGNLFAHRIRSRDEFINSYSKVHDLKALFPCGDHMVSIIDDREDVWNYAPNLITVKAYRFFKSTGDIHNPFNVEASTPANKSKSSTDDISQQNDGLLLPEKGHLKISIDNKTENDPEAHGAGKGLEIDLTDDSKSKKDNMQVSDEKLCEDIEASYATNLESASRKPDFKKKVGDSDSDLDDYLNYLDEILERVHDAFYSTLDGVRKKGGSAIMDPKITRFCTIDTVNPDVRVVVPALRRQTLAGANLVFTGIIPTNVMLEKSRSWKIAVSLGARVTQDIIVQKQPNQKGNFTTHVIAARHGTQKAHKASRVPGLKLVNPNWLYCCWERWTWIEEILFPVPKGMEQMNCAPFRSTSNSKGIESMAECPLMADGSCQPNEILDTRSPLASFSKQVIADMDKEVEELLNCSNEEEESSESALKLLPTKVEKSNVQVACKKRKNSSSQTSLAKRKKTHTIPLLSGKNVSKVHQEVEIKSNEVDENKQFDTMSGSNSDSDTSFDSDGESSCLSSDFSSETSDSDHLSDSNDEEISNMLERRISESTDSERH